MGVIFYLYLFLGGGSNGVVLNLGEAYLDNFEVAAKLIGWPLATDLDRDGFIDWGDVMVISEYWLDTSPDKADLNKDGIVNFLDFAKFALVW